jgi:uncharacterized protein YabN with tetrapyrrole methylase and pyrophosphatase domain
MSASRLCRLDCWVLRAGRSPLHGPTRKGKSLARAPRSWYQTALMRPRKRTAIEDLLGVMARLRAPNGCPWDHEQDHMTLRYHAVEEAYELLDAIEAGDDHALEEELGDLLLQVVFHAQMARERGAFDFEQVARHLTDKLVHRHPHVFGTAKVRDAAGVLAQWDELKHAEKKGTRHERASALDGIPKHLPALLRAEKLLKKARKAKLLGEFPGANDWSPSGKRTARLTQRAIAQNLLGLVELARGQGWSAEELLRTEALKRERQWRKAERAKARGAQAHRRP